jgi:hypothetical protein
MGSSHSTSSEMEDPKAYRSALQASPSLSPTHLSSKFKQERGVSASPTATGMRSYSPAQSACPSFLDNNQEEVDEQDSDIDSDTPPATPTTFAAQARDISSNSNDHRRLSSLCLDIRDAAESRGTNGDIRKACKWLLNREGVPQRLR